jgi:hypothetical protein
LRRQKTKPRERLFRWQPTLTKGTSAKNLDHADPHDDR